MYIAIEGIKGSGKTTLIKGLKKYLENKEGDIKPITANPTESIPVFSIAEKMSKMFSFLRKIDKWNEYLYTLRSNYVGKHTNWEQPLIIGDRSIITSYVTRWNKWKNPNICINKVNKKENTILPPNCVIYLNISPEIAEKRLKQRQNNKNSVKYHESIDSLKEANNAYKEIQRNSIQIDRISGTKWYNINIEQRNEEEVLSDCIKIVDKIINSNI